ncbi:MAG: N-acetyltransferase [Aromatoleum sp.]|nr:N-acetyltransferase [Aromatoleum sp.]
MNASTSALPTATGSTVVRDDVALESLAASEWDALVPGQPLLSHAFLTALHASGCASPSTGWRPRYLTAWRGGRLTGAVPLYEKAHSYGEYVFDWAWADAYRRYGRRYYPKLVGAIPFTPAPGPRIIAGDDDTRQALLTRALATVRDGDRYSSLHLLFITEAEAVACAGAGMLIRNGVQFRWENPGYRDFGDFLATFNHDKRKKVKQDRRKLAEAGVTFSRKTGRDISAADWAFFYRCYENTYRAHQSTPYLSRECFERLGATMADHLLLVTARRDGVAVCAALDVFDGATLWGRYWGAIEYVPGLHFEACYYQAIEFCIERGIARFEGGAQGLHKLARGLMPTTTRSAHVIADPDFEAAIAQFCARERINVAHTVGELEAAGPFRAGAGNLTERAGKG